MDNNCACARTAALRARPSALNPRPPRCRRNASPNGQTTVVAEAVRPRTETEHADHRAHVRSAAQTLYCAPVRPRPSRRTTVASCRREDGCSGATLRARESNDEHHSTMRAAPGSCMIGVCLAHSHPHGIGALRAAQRRSVLWRRARAFRASYHGTHDALNVARTPRLKRTRTEKA